jgi:hypothetical protein
MGRREPRKSEPLRFKLVQLSAVVLANELEFGEDQEWVSHADAMFRRYAIVDERDLRDAVELLAKGTIMGQSRQNLKKVASG